MALCCVRTVEEIGSSWTGTDFMGDVEKLSEDRLNLRYPKGIQVELSENRRLN